MSDIKIDFIADWTEFLRQELIAGGYSVSPSDGHHEVGYKYFSVFRRRITLRCRIIHVAQEFLCPAELEAGLQEIRRKVEAGEDLRPHQSQRVLAVDSEDPLLNHWDVHHLHLGTTVDASGFVARTGPLLFARVLPDDFYMVGIFQHGAWSRQIIVQRIHDNWPDSIAPYRLRGVSLEPQLSDDDVKILRDHGVSTMVQVADATIYAPLGLGYSTAGTSIHAGMMSDRFLRKVADLETWVSQHIDRLQAAALATGVDIRPPLEFKLEIHNGYAYTVEARSKVAFRLVQL